MKIHELAALNVAIDQISENKLPIKSAYALTKNKRLIKGDLEDTETVRRTLIEKYGEKKDGELVQNEGRVNLVDAAAFASEFETVLNTDVEISLHKIAIADLGDIEVSVKVLDALMPMLED